MKTTLFVLCLFVSAMVALKSKEDITEDFEEDYDPSVEIDATLENLTPAETSSVHAAESFQYKPSQRLEKISKNLPKDKIQLIKSGNVMTAMTDTFKNSMNTAVATEGLVNLDHEWQLMVAGPEAARVLGTFGKNLNQMLTSPRGLDFISTAYTTAHVLLSKAGEETRGSGLGKILSKAIFLLTSPEMPGIVDKTGRLIVEAVNKPYAAIFIRSSWDEVLKSLMDRSLNAKLNKCYSNILSLMKSFNESDNSDQGKMVRSKSMSKINSRR